MSARWRQIRFLNRIGSVSTNQNASALLRWWGGVLCCQMIAFCIPFVFDVISSYFAVGFVKNTKNSEYFCHYVISSDFVCRSDLVVGLVTMIIIKLQKNRGRCQQKMQNLLQCHLADIIYIICMFVYKMLSQVNWWQVQ